MQEKLDTKHTQLSKISSKPSLLTTHDDWMKYSVRSQMIVVPSTAFPPRLIGYYSTMYAGKELSFVHSVSNTNAAAPQTAWHSWIPALILNAARRVFKIG